MSRKVVELPDGYRMIVIKLPGEYFNLDERERAWRGLVKDAGHQYGQLRRVVNHESTGAKVTIEAIEEERQ